MNKLQANLCLICVTLLWSTEVIIFACIPDSVSPFATTSITGLIGAVLLFLCFFKRIKAEIKKGGKKLLLRTLLLSVLNCSYNILYQYGLDFFDVSTGAFTLSMTVVILPVILLMVKKSVGKKTWISALLVLVGIAFSYIGKIDSVNLYGFLTLVGGCVIRAVYIIKLNDYAKEHDPVTLSALISLIVGVISYAIWFIFQPATFGAIEWNSQVIASLFIYAYFIVAFAQTLNIFAQRRATAASATIIYSLEIIFSLIWGITMPADLVDPVTPNVYMMIGAAFIILGNLAEIVDFSRVKAIGKGREQLG
ncbi:MAG: DMT family transporter [Ruminococcus sp.]|uniref:DMT family transporter n=1 Tax=Ruminococcus sp. TaxID=41978 RepID=UPI002872CCD9|nr:DMT family transporter [Ruminococcus sp.]MBQ3285753.1 DMT family transporter [Ruminococcus sp.]